MAHGSGRIGLVCRRRRLGRDSSHRVAPVPLRRSGTAGRFWASARNRPRYGDSCDPFARAATPPGQKPVPSTGATHRNSTTKAQGALPVRVVILRAGLSAPVVPVGVRDDGGAEVPADPAQAGWYRFGPAPGDAHGSAVLVGHVDSHTGELGELAALYDVRAGDRVDVQRGDGTTLTYEIVARRIVKKDRMPADTFRREGEPVLTLITCAPPYDADRGGYQSNLIVTAVRSAS